MQQELELSEEQLVFVRPYLAKMKEGQEAGAIAARFFDCCARQAGLAPGQYTVGPDGRQLIIYRPDKPACDEPSGGR